jgi:hypothetical protein
MKSNGSQEVERVRQARCILERMRGRLLRPTFQALESSGTDLNLAVECLRQLDLSLKSPIWQGLTRRKLENEVVALRHAVRSVEELLKGAGKFYAGLARLMAPDEAPPNYTAAGMSGTASRPNSGTVAVHG